nr:MAG TPA: hypothetical protein [Caudoviricetes sp.]
MKQEKALINFYARVVAKGQMNLTEVPQEIREKVRIKSLEEMRKLEESQYKEL